MNSDGGLFRLDGKTAVVTGASSGLGVVFARALAGAGQIPQASYTASKGGVVNLTRELAAQWRPTSGCRLTRPALPEPSATKPR